MQPCAIIVLLLPHVNLEPKIHQAIMETLDCYGWLDEGTKQPDVASAQREVKRYERR